MGTHAPPGARTHTIGRNDVVVAAAAVAGLALSAAAVKAMQRGEPRLTWSAATVLVLGAAPLVARRRWPVPVWALVGAASALYGAVDWPDPSVPFAPFVALVAVFEHAGRRARVGVALLTLAAAVVGTALTADSDALDWWTAGLVVVGGPLVGDYLLKRRQLLEEAAARLVAVEHDRQRALDDARAAERTRVARELHDVVAHDVTMLVIQAEAAAASGGADGAGAASRRFDDIAASGRAALGGLRRMLGVLRDDAAPPLAPQPGLHDLGALVTGVRTSGVEVDLSVVGPVDTLPAAVSIAGYRIVQEAITNAAKHARGAAVAVRATVDDDALRISVTNGPASGAADPTGSGLGLVGLRERVAVLGGTLSATPTPTGGFDVRACVPTSTRIIVDGRDAIERAGRLRPDVVLMDIRMPILDGIAATRRLAGPGVTDPCRVLILTTFDLDEYVYEALKAGASGFLLKDATREELADAVRIVARGDALIAPSVTKRLIGEFRQRGPRPMRHPALEQLTPREHEVLLHLARGRTNAEIARELVLGEATVKTHVAHVLMKLGLRDRVQAVILAYEQGLVVAGGDA